MITTVMQKLLLTGWPGAIAAPGAELACLPFLIGFVLDLLLGDPPGWPHPVRLIGWLIRHLETILRRLFPATPMAQRRAGFVLAVSVPLLAFFMSLSALAVARRIHFWFGFSLECLLTWQILAACCLKRETGKVRKALQDHDLPKARRMLSGLVGRDTDALSETAVIQGAVETIAENTTDGVIAPLFYLALGGVPLAMACKAINTLDSMVGYRNEKYLYFGRCSAKLDDAINFVPARLAAVLMFAGSVLLGCPAGRTWSIFWRDRSKHASPNSAQTESVCAGALGIQLGGCHSYAGKMVAGATIGDRTREPAPHDIKTAQKLLCWTAWLGLLLCLPLRISTALWTFGLGG
jgi:adenosylcobinamide-phosphate synthase